MNIKDELFGPTKDEVWQLFAQEVNGKYFYGGYADPAKVDVKFKNWTITLDTNIASATNEGSMFTPKTKFRVPFLSKENLQLVISNPGLFDSLAVFFGGQDILTGFDDLDDTFVIKGNDTDKIIKLFSSDKIREIVLKIKFLHLEIRDHDPLLGNTLPKGISELYLYVEDIITDITILKLLYQLCTEILDQLFKVGIVDEQDPNFNLG